MSATEELLTLRALGKIPADLLRYFSYFPQKTSLTFHANCLQFAGNIKTRFLEKKYMKNIINLFSELAQRVVKVNPCPAE